MTKPRRGEEPGGKMRKMVRALEGRHNIMHEVCGALPGRNDYKVMRTPSSSPLRGSSLGAILCLATFVAIARLRRFHPASVDVMKILKRRIS